MVRFVRKPVHTKAYGCISGGSDDQAVHAPPGYSSRSGLQPKQRAHPDIDCSRIRRTESRGVEVECKRYSIGLRDNDQDAESFVVYVCDGVECHLAIAEALLRELAAGVPWLLGTYGKETLGPNGEQGIPMVEWSGVGV